MVLNKYTPTHIHQSIHPAIHTYRDRQSLLFALNLACLLFTEPKLSKMPHFVFCECRISTNFYIFFPPHYCHQQHYPHTHLSITSSDYTHIIYEDKLHHRHITIFWDVPLCSMVIWCREMNHQSQQKNFLMHLPCFTKFFGQLGPLQDIQQCME